MRLLIALGMIVASAAPLGSKLEGAKAHDSANRHVRNYDAPLTKQEKDDISYIIKYLSEKSSSHSALA